MVLNDLHLPFIGQATDEQVSATTVSELPSLYQFTANIVKFGELPEVPAVVTFGIPTDADLVYLCWSESSS
ncbi:uncharacterized protein N7515_005872 [Penicillium bovifimosum]|uniref:Uncharacterized protein n=1 Tax=Penicillium bovifimosum TaxID=126998 RepID=A0A9W9GTZ4_9EURO|nr:uncharacterized protein N7515_005872 [Penicillium bovifimosum]KAJ5129833.1 hypothetical protein N7515_005872 [Penicillium bovifimosum]